MTEKRPSILITGANGFVGARLCRKFINEGFIVYAGVRRTADLSRLSDLTVQLRYGDMTNPDSLPEMVAGVDYIIHNAGVVKVKNKKTFFDINETGTENLLKATVEYNPNVKKFIYISSLAAAGPSIGNNPVSEADEPKPLTTYGHSKLAGERKSLSYADRIPVLSIRPPGIYGPGDTEILSFFQTVNNRVKPFIGNCSRKLQLVHVDDLCRGIFMAMISDTNSGEIYFIADKDAYSMKELINNLQTAIGRSAIPIYIPSAIFKLIARITQSISRLFGITPMLTVEKANELLASWEMSVNKAKQDFGFESEIKFVDGAKETYQWYKKEGWL
jgi:nucleoside-diphosphate-sugar epimerase